MNRRGFLRSTAIGSGVAAVAGAVVAAEQNEAAEINVGLIGAGAQAQVLLKSCLLIPGVRFKAICDIWADYNLKEVSQAIKDCGMENNAYVDYKEMLEKEKGLQAVIVATPDFCHAEQSIACLKAGLNVYCETPMAHNLEAAKQMAAAARDSGKLLQVGTHRRSHPRYIHCVEKLIREITLLGKVGVVNGQWNRPMQPDRGFPRRTPVDDATLAKFGYKTMPQFRNWRWYKDLSGGPVVECAAHQADVFNWFLGATPKSIMASAGTDVYDKKTHESFDTAVVLLEYDTKTGPVRAMYQVVSMNGNLGGYEKFLGNEGALVVSEGIVNLFREESAPDWDRWVNLDLLLRLDKKKEGSEAATVSVIESIQPLRYALPGKYEELPHKAHLDNFFAAVRGKAKLNCPAETAYKTAVTAFKIREAAETGKRIDLKAEDFKA